MLYDNLNYLGSQYKKRFQKEGFTKIISIKKGVTKR